MVEETIDRLLIEFSALNLNRFYERLLQIRGTFRENILKVAIVAPVSSGKSTLLCGLTNGRFLVTSNNVESAFIVRIKHGNQILLKTLEDDVLAEGYHQVREKIGELNRAVREGTSDVSELVLETPMQLLERNNLQNCSIQLYDSPGPNEGNISDAVKQRITEIYDTVDVFILIHNHSSFGIGYQDTMMRELDALNLLQREEVTRVYHCINMHGDDEHRMEGDMDEAESVELVSEFLQGYGIENPQVFVVNALYAKLSRTVLNDAIDDPRNLEDFKRLFRLRNPTDEDVREEAEHYEEMSGITQFEEQIFDQILREDLHIKRDRVVQDITQVLDLVDTMKQLLYRFHTAYHHIQNAQLDVVGADIVPNTYREYADANGYLNNQLLSYYQNCQQQLVGIFNNIRNLVGDLGFELSAGNIPAPDINALVQNGIVTGSENYDVVERRVRQVPTQETYYVTVRKEIGRTGRRYGFCGPRDAIYGNVSEARTRTVDKPQEYDATITKQRNIYTINATAGIESIRTHIITNLASSKARWLNELQNVVNNENYPDDQIREFVLANYVNNHALSNVPLEQYRNI
eukprot:TRINITY_DN254_c0_g2_i1.p1 TRINITY_DN254_c0_g2~~TRINITY_DN254_c0_g2_i1.p1  ORF type:complete len:576 (+),score=122.34 TRINITY_DN254_c0_g2_i1:41-1768(+)